MLIALTRKVNPQLDRCALEFQTREPIDIAKAIEQHRVYEQTLESLGARVISLPALDEQPDCVFVEDPAIVLDEIAVITHMGAASRRGESESLADALGRFRPLARITGPATLEGGDAVRVGRTLFVGLSRRTNIEGVKQLAAIIEPLGYRIAGVPVTGCLHLKSACCIVSGEGEPACLLINRNWIDMGAFHDDHNAEIRILDVPLEEPGAADVLRLGDTVLIPASFPRTRALLESSGHHVRAIDVSELQKAEAGVTCMSLVFDVPSVPHEKIKHA